MRPTIGDINKGEGMRTGGIPSLEEVMKTDTLVDRKTIRLMGVSEMTAFMTGHATPTATEETMTPSTTGLQTDTPTTVRAA